jgi:glutamine synthetase
MLTYSDKELPLNLFDALWQFKENDVLADAIGRDLATAYYNHRLQQVRICNTCNICLYT